MMEAKWFTPDIDRQHLSISEVSEQLQNLEIQYQQETNRILQIFEYSNESVFIANAKGEILNINKHLLLTFDYSEKHNLVGRNMMCLFSEFSSNAVLDDIISLYDHGVISYRKHYLKSFSGSRFLASIRMVLLTDKFNRTIGILGVINNIIQENLNVTKFVAGERILRIAKGLTDEEQFSGNLKELNRMLQQSYSEIQSYSKQLKATNEKLEKYDRLKSAFLQNISHEIRTPLNGIVGFAELLTRKSISEFRKKEYCIIIKESSTRLLNIINDLLDISKIESGNIEISIRELNINELFNEIHQSYLKEISEKNLSFRINSLLIKGQEYLYTDRQKLSRIFYHLLSNSIKFTDEGYIELGVQMQNETIQFYVKDTGAGIPENMAGDIFEHFRKGDDEKSKFESGIGVGLSLCKAYVELLGGQITLESEQDKGTIVYFSIPFENKEILESDNTLDFNISYRGINWMNKTILIVEDEEYNYVYLKEILKKTKANVIHAATAKLAIEMFISVKSIDVVLLDVKLPDMSGYNVAKIIKKDKPSTVIIVQTAYAQEADREEALNLGCDDYIAKPIQPALFLLKLKKFLS